MSFTEFFQTVVDGLVLGSLFGLLGVGFGLILGVTGRFHFAYATTGIFAVYVGLALVNGGTPLYVGIGGGIAFAVLLGISLEWLLYRPLVESTSQALLAVFVTALGVVVIGENLIRLVWGSSSQNLGVGYTVKRIVLGGDVGLTTLDLVTFVVCAAIVVALWLFIRSTSYGRAIRAVRENPDMAQAVGINPQRAYLAVFGIGSALSGVGMILLTQRGAAAPDAGLQPTFTALVITFLAGTRSTPLRFAVTGVIVSLIQQFCLIKIDAGWTPVVTFGILFIYIALTPLLEGRTVRLRPVAPGTTPGTAG